MRILPRILFLVGTWAASLAAAAVADVPDSAALSRPQVGMEIRHAQKVAAIKNGKYDLLLIGDSITQNLEKPAYQEVWAQFYGRRNAINLGYSGGRTENILWNLQHGELEGQSPKGAVLLIGTNDSDDANYPEVHTAVQIAEGTVAILRLLRQRLPQTKILVLRIFPRQNYYFKADHSEIGSMKRRFAVNQRAGDLVATAADGTSIFYLDVNHVFFRLDGSIDPVLMPDLLHPSPRGAWLCAQAMEPTLSALLGDANRATPQANSAVLPVPKLEHDFYDWWERHAAVLGQKDRIDPEIVLLGDSITHLWGGDPAWSGRPPNGPASFARTFAGRRVLNLGFGFDRIQNVLWRLDHGEFEGLHPGVVVVNIGTNNLVSTAHARSNSPEEIAQGIREVLLRIRAKSPESRIVLMALFPRGRSPNDPFRPSIKRVNALIGEFGTHSGITFLDLGPKLLQPDGSVSASVLGDYLHPTEVGYSIWGEALNAVIESTCPGALPAQSVAPSD